MPRPKRIRDPRRVSKNKFYRTVVQCSDGLMRTVTTNVKTKGVPVLLVKR